jgi:hypothetical protein
MMEFGFILVQVLEGLFTPATRNRTGSDAKLSFFSNGYYNYMYRKRHNELSSSKGQYSDTVECGLYVEKNSVVLSRCFPEQLANMRSDTG